MRFDLTVNEFTRDLWADRELEVFGEQFWRPYIHVRDAGARRAHRARRARRDRSPARCSTSAARARTTASSTSSRRSGKQIDRGSVTYVKRDEDPRDYKVSFDKIRAELGFETLMTVPDGIAEIIAALEAGRSATRSTRATGTSPERRRGDRRPSPSSRSSTCGSSRRTSRRWPRRCAPAG